MSAVKNVFKSQMIILKDQNLVVNNSEKNGEDIFTASNHLSDVIENADGVPYQLVFGSLPGEGYYIHIGEGVRTLFGLEPGSFTEAAFQNMIEEVDPLLDHIPVSITESRTKFINGELEKYNAEILVRTASGERKWIRDSSLPLKDEGTGKVIGSYGILFDVSERKLAAKYLKQAAERSDECDKLKNAFLNNISHEVRTPLNAIVGFSALLCEPEQRYGQKKEFIDMISSSTDHFLEMMDNILEISRIETGTVRIIAREVNPSNMIKRMYNRFIKQATEKAIALNYEIPDNASDIEMVTDGYKLMQIFNNLLDNALKFTISGEVNFGYRRMEKCLEFYVHDTGIGIPENRKEFIFKKFYQVDSGITRRFQGVGLGLSISKAYVELLGGRIDFRSEAGFGSEFFFTLPS
jgi:signal transduction histidine kinase